MRNNIYIYMGIGLMTVAICGFCIYGRNPAALFAFLFTLGFVIAMFARVD